MRADLQAILNTPPVSSGKLDQDKQLVLAWLYMILWAPNINFNINTIYGKAQGMQGVTPSNLEDLQIYGLSRYLGYGNYTWDQLVSVAKAAVDGGGVNNAGLQKYLDTDDVQDLLNYSLLTAAKVISDAS